MTLRVDALSLGPIGTNCYIVRVDSASPEAVVVDPSGDATELRLTLAQLGTRCVACHTIDGDGGTTGPELCRVGARRDAEAIRRIDNDPNDEYGDSMMPVYGKRLSPEEIGALAAYLATRK